MAKYQDQPTINYKSLKFTFIGPPEVGKTTTRKRLTEEVINLSSSPQAATESTQLQKPLTVQMNEKSAIAPLHVGSLQWKESDRLGEMQLLLHHIQKKEYHSHQISLEHSHPMPESQDSSQLVATKMEDPQGKEEKRLKVWSATGRDDHLQPLSSEYVEKMVREFLEQRKLTDIEQLEETVIAYFMDFGGQPEFQEILPLLLRGPALHLVFFNAFLSLNEPVHVRFRSQMSSGNPCIEYNTTYTACEMLFQIISSLYCLSNRQRPVPLPSGQALPYFEPTAILIGTHIDLYEGKPIDKVNCVLEELFQRTEFWKEDFLRVPEECNTHFYPLDNKHGTVEEVRGLQKFIQLLIKHRLSSAPLPMSWLFFHLALQHCHEKDGLCTMKECVELAAQCNIPEEDVEPILHYIHNHIGTVLHYADVPGLSDIVFCDPNKLLEAINRVVIVSFVGDRSHPKRAQEIRNTGEVSLKLLQQLEDQGATSSCITNQMAICLLKHFKIITEIPNEGKFLVPCLLLPDYSVMMPSQEQLKEMDPPPLLIQFECGYTPVSVFSGLGVELTSQYKWDLKKEGRFRNHLVFNCSSWTVGLIGHFHFVQAHIMEIDEDEESPLMPECCKLVKNDLTKALKKVCSMYEHTKKMKFYTGLYCPCTSSNGSEPHFCKFKSNTRMICSKTEKRYSLGNGDIWFREVHVYVSFYSYFILFLFLFVYLAQANSKSGKGLYLEGGYSEMTGRLCACLKRN